MLSLAHEVITSANYASIKLNVDQLQIYTVLTAATLQEHHIYTITDANLILNHHGLPFHNEIQREFNQFQIIPIRLLEQLNIDPTITEIVIAIHKLDFIQTVQECRNLQPDEPIFDLSACHLLVTKIENLIN